MRDPASACGQCSHWESHTHGFTQGPLWMAARPKAPGPRAVISASYPIPCIQAKTSSLDLSRLRADTLVFKILRALNSPQPQASVPCWLSLPRAARKGGSLGPGTGGAMPSGGWCPAQEFCICLPAGGSTLTQSPAKTTPFCSCWEPRVWGRAQLCQLSETEYATQLGHESHSSTGDMLSGGARNHLGSVLQDVQLAERGAGAGRGWGGGEGADLSPVKPACHTPSTALITTLSI